jgi:hypothetical protein
MPMCVTTEASASNGKFLSKAFNVLWCFYRRLVVELLTKIRFGRYSGASIAEKTISMIVRPRLLIDGRLTL